MRALQDMSSIGLWVRQKGILVRNAESQGLSLPLSEPILVLHRSPSTLRPCAPGWIP